MGSISFSGRRLSFSGALHSAGLCLALLMLGCGWFAHTALEQKEHQLDERLTQSRAILKRADQIRKRYATAKRSAAEAHEHLVSLQRRLPSSPDETAFLQQLSELSARTQLRIDRFRPQQTLDRAPYKCLGIQLGAQGTYESVCRFLAGLEQLPRLCHVRRLSVTAPLDASGLCTVELELDLFYQPQAVQLAGKTQVP